MATFAYTMIDTIHRAASRVDDDKSEHDFGKDVIPRVVSRKTRSPAAAAANFMFWELMKIVLVIAMLVAVAKWAPGLSWPALLVTMVVCMKSGWLALLRRR